jgi:hypothetical protein
MREKPLWGFGKGVLMFEVEGDTDFIELLDHISQMEGKEIS